MLNTNMDTFYSVEELHIQTNLLVCRKLLAGNFLRTLWRNLLFGELNTTTASNEKFNGHSIFYVAVGTLVDLSTICD